MVSIWRGGFSVAATVALGASLLGVGVASGATGPGVITEYAVPTADSHPDGIAAGPDGNVWFTEASGNKIGRITPAGAISEFPVPTSASNPQAIAAGPDGNMWFTESDKNKIGMITPSGNISEFPVPTAASHPDGIAAGPDGNMWFTEYQGQKIGRIDPVSKDIDEFPVPMSDPVFGATFPLGIAAGADGNMWFAESSKNRVGRITPSGTITEYTLSTDTSSPSWIAAGPDGNLWLTRYAGATVGHITPGSGTITEFTFPTPAGGPYGIAAGPDGNMWVALYGSNKVARVSPGGEISEFAVPTGTSGPRGIAAGPDGGIWFTEHNGNKIGRITPGEAAAERRPYLATSGQVGLPLLCDADVWGPNATVTTTWQRDGATIAEQTGPSYTPVQADIGTVITCTTRTRLPSVLTVLIATSNPITIIGPTESGGVTDTPLAAVWAPGTKTAKAGKTLKVQYAVTSAAVLQAQLKGKKTLTKQLNAKAGTNTLKWKLPKNLKAGKYSLRLFYEGALKASTKVKVTR